MSQPVVKYWAPATTNTATISSLQDYAAAGNLILNPTSFNSQVSKNGPYVYDGVIRKVSFTSANNLSARTITISGIGSAIDAAGNPTAALASITENLSGPNANTIQSANIYSQIDSISINGAANGLSAGFGNAGITSYVFADYDRTAWYATYQAAIYARTTLTYTVYISATKPQTPTVDGRLTTYPEVIPSFALGTADATVDQMLTTAYPVVLAWATIKDAAAERFYFTVLQQGTRS